MNIKKFISFSALLILISILFSAICMPIKNADIAYADTNDTTQLDPLATDASKCGFDYCGKQPRNCLFLEEPIGGKPNFDLYLADCKEGACTDGKYVEITGGSVCRYALWNGGAVPPGYLVKQALLTEDPSKPYQGPFGLLYSYIQLIYAYMSGIIVGVSVLFVVIGGVQMSISGGDETKFTAGKSRITKAIVGIIIWFTASLILYTINPTFFAF